MTTDDPVPHRSATLESPPPLLDPSGPLLDPKLGAPVVETWRPPADVATESPSTGTRRERERRERALRRRRMGLLALTLKIGLVVFITYGLVFNFSVVRGKSMSPGIHDGDRILVDHLSFVFRDVHRGDIVVLQYPLDPTLDYIKRVIGLPGDEVRIDHGSVFVNGERLDEPYISEPDARGSLCQRVAPDSYFVLGDNRPHSSDSREFGLVPRQNLVGRVNVRVWPPERAGLLN
jgi:signal peptidase I